MLLSKLVYLCVKNAVYYDDNSFTYEQFLQGKHDGDPDYAVNILNAYAPINEAIMRLSDLERIPYRVENVTLSSGVFSKSSLSRSCKSIVAVATRSSDGTIEPLEFSEAGSEVLVFGVSDGVIAVEYKEDIPYFGESPNDYNYVYVANSLGGLVLSEYHDTELLDYGISTLMCSAISEYAKGSLGEQVAPELANMHLSRAEQYLLNIEPVKSALRQRGVRVRHRIGE